MKESMDKSSPEYLTADELRNRLYHSLRNRGMVNSIKSQLRNSLVTELQQSLKGQLSLRDLKDPDEGSLIHRAANSLIVDHLRCYGYDYTNSVFLPESGLAHDKIFSKADFLQLLHINPQSKLHQQLLSCEEKTGKGFLWKFLFEMSAIHASSTQEFGVQTDLIKVGPISSLDEKLQVLDQIYSSKRDDIFKSSSMLTEERILSFQKQMEERYQSQLKQEIRRMRENELTRLKVEERENSRKEMDQLRRDMERDYQTRYDSLLVRERNATERFHREQEIRDKEMHSTRQNLQEEISCIHHREAEVKREADVNNREKKLNEERIKAKEEGIRHREMEVKRREIEYNQRLENEMIKFKLDQQAKFINRTQNLEVREVKVKENERLVSEEKDKIQSYKDDLRDKTARVNELETFLQEARHKEVSATRHNEYLNSKLRDMSDYSTVKEQASTQRQELETLRTRLAEVMNMNERERGRQEELLREMRRPTPETLMMQRDMERARENLRQEQVVFEQQKQLLESRLKDEIDRNRDMMTRFEEQTLQMKEMNREVVDLRQHLSVTNIALNNEVYRRPHSDVEGRTSIHHSQKSEKHVDFQTETRSALQTSNRQSDLRHSRRPAQYRTQDIYNEIDFDLDIGALPTDHYDPPSEDLSSATCNSADVVADAKYRLKTLEKEAKNLEKAYQNFHYNITNPSSVPDPTFSINQSEPEQFRSRSGTSQHISPTQSPIPHSRPLSSTPHYHSTKTHQYTDDSFEELSRGSKEKVKQSDPLLKFNLSNMSADDDQEKTRQLLQERRERSRPITVDDLEARPGSPDLVVVAGSESPSEPSPEKEISENADKPTPAFLLPPVSLDDAWKTSNENTDDGEKYLEREMEELEKERWEEERREREEERKKLEREEWNREQQALEKLEGKNHGVSEEEKQMEDDGEKKEEIDPVMQQYMAMVQQNRQKEQESAKQALTKWTAETHEKSPIPSDEEISVAENLKSVNGSDDGFSW